MKKSIKQIINLISKQKFISYRQIVIIIKQCLILLIKEKFPFKSNFFIKINYIENKFWIFRKWLIVKKVNNSITEVKLILKKLNNKQKYIYKLLFTSSNFNYIMTLMFKKLFVKQLIKQQNKLNLIPLITNKILIGNVKQIKYNYLVIDLGYQVNGILLKKYLLPKDNFNIGDKIRTIFFYQNKNQVIFLSRSNNLLLLELLKLEIPEIKNKIIEIKLIARKIGIRTKLAVISHNNLIDPIGACIGIKGIRIKNITKELQNEQLDIMVWNKDPKIFIKNIFNSQNIKIINCTFNLSLKIITIIVNKIFLPKILGKQGYNFRLICQLLKNTKIILKTI